MWTVILFGLFAVRKRWVFWLALPSTALGALILGFKDAGSYRGYTAGSILSPDRYRDTTASLIYGDGTGMNASQLNAKLADMRGENLPTFVLLLFLFVLFLGAAYLVSVAYAHSCAEIDDVLDDDEARGYFVRRYEAAVGPYPESAFTEGIFRVKLVNFVYDLATADNWRLLLADSPESFITEIAAPLHSRQSEGLGKALKLFM